MILEGWACPKGSSSSREIAVYLQASAWRTSLSVSALPRLPQNLL